MMSMFGRRWFWIGLSLALVLGAVIAVTLALTPQETNPAFAAAVNFMNAAGKGDDLAALPLLSDALQGWVRDNCPDGRVSACIQAYTPPEWGGLLSAVFRRAVPDGAAWNVDLIATYEKDRGFSGVCSAFRVEADADGRWRIQRWAGFIWCGDPASRSMMSNPDAPNQAP
jgi:hypothetical protein